MTTTTTRKEACPVILSSFARRRYRWLPWLHMRSGLFDGRYPTVNAHGPTWAYVSQATAYRLGHFLGRHLRDLDLLDAMWAEYLRRVEISMRWGAHQKHLDVGRGDLPRIREATTSIRWAFMLGYHLQRRGR